MRLLIVTQAIDAEDPVLGFFCCWVEEFAQHCERIEVICLKEGKHALPGNVRVHSLGKPSFAKATEGAGTRFLNRIRYTWRFLSLAWRLRGDYDAVFVHMNPEYVLIAGWLWQLFGKRIYLWRNHYAGSSLTGLAVAFCTKVFCTSKHSYTARYAKTVLMPVGVDTSRFTPDLRVARVPHSILFLARMAPAKRPEMLLDALAELARRGVPFTATFVGSPLPRDAGYYASLVERVRAEGLADRVTFRPGIANSETPDLYRAHQVFVNTSPSGMLDKTIFEATASGCRVLAASADFAELAGSESYFENATELAEKISVVLAHQSVKTDVSFVESNSLTVLADQLIAAL